MKLTHHRCGDYLLPDLTIPDKPVALGKYGRMRKTYALRYSGRVTGMEEERYDMDARL